MFGFNPNFPNIDFYALSSLLAGMLCNMLPNSGKLITGFLEGKNISDQVVSKALGTVLTSTNKLDTVTFLDDVAKSNVAENLRTVLPNDKTIVLNFLENNNAEITDPAKTSSTLISSLDTLTPTWNIDELGNENYSGLKNNNTVIDIMSRSVVDTSRKPGNDTDLSSIAIGQNVKLAALKYV